MSLYSKFLRKVLFPAAELTMGIPISSQLKFLEKSQWWSPQELREYQNKKLRALIKHSYENVPYYHRVFKERKLRPEDIKTTEDLSKLPLLTKKDMTDNFDDLYARNMSPKTWFLSSSGGTTGNTLTYRRDKQSKTFYRAANIRAWSWAGAEIGDKFAYLWSNPSTINSTKQLKTKLMYRIRRSMLLNMYDVTEEKLLEYHRDIRKFKPSFAYGYASGIHLLAKAKVTENYQFKAILPTAENLTELMRKDMEKAFNCKVFDQYGGEAGSLALQCEVNRNYHMCPEGSVMEFLKDGAAVASDELGEIVVTDFYNYSMPFIRYRIGDLAVPTDENCECGRGLPLIKSVEGRASDVIQTPSGKILTRPSFFGSANIKKIKGMKEYQVVQERKDKLVIKLIPDTDFSEDTERVILGMARDIMGEGVDIEIDQVEKIPVAPSGKRKVIISKVSYDFNKQEE